MRTALTRTAAVLAATAAPLAIATAAPASAAPTGPIVLTGTVSDDGASINLLFNGLLPLSEGACTSTVRGLGAGGETIVTTVMALPFTPFIRQTISPKTANVYAVSYTCTAGGFSSSNGTSLFFNIDGGLPLGTGTPGPAGPAGPTGPTGPQGPQGETGPQGPTGNDGAPGQTGPQGPAGTNGNDGAPGQTGPQGPAGNDGAPGAPGQTGPQGPQGPQGPIGPQGPLGGRTPFGS